MLLAVAAGALLALSFPLPAGFPSYPGWPLALAGAATLPLAVRGVRARAAFGLALLAGLTFFVPTLAFTQVAGVDAWLLLAASQAVILALAGPAFAAVQRLPASGVWVAAVWVADEALRSRAPFGGFPWARLAFSQVGGPLAPLAALGGAPLVTAAVALTGAAVVTAARSGGGAGRARWVAAAAASPLLGLVVPLPTAGQPDAAGRGSAVVAVVQGNVPRLGFAFNAQRRAVLDNHVAATEELAAAVRAGRVPAPDLVVWPENSSDLDPFTSPDAAAQLTRAAAAIGRPVLVGAVLDGPGPSYVSNTGLVWTANGPTGQSYVKRHPVPFAEYVPFRAQLTAVVGRLRNDISRDFAAGTRVGVLDVGPARVGDVICFEVAYDGLVRDPVAAGARLLAVQTNNATFGFSAESAQQLQMTRLRAMEHGRAAVVASTSGISAVIRPDGRVAQQSGIFTRAVLVDRVPLRSTRTAADRAGSWPEAGIAAAALVAVAAGTVVGRRRRGRRR